MWLIPKAIERSRLFTALLFCFILTVTPGSHANSVENIYPNEKNQENLNPLNEQQNIIISQSQPTVTNYISRLSMTPIFNKLFEYNSKKNPQEQKNEPITDSGNINDPQKLDNTRISIETDKIETHTDVENANRGSNNAEDKSLNPTTLCSSDNDQKTEIPHSICINPELKQDETSKNPNECIEMDQIEIHKNNSEEDISKTINSIDHVPQDIIVSDSNQKTHQMQEQMNIQTNIIKNPKQLKKNNEINKIKHVPFEFDKPVDSHLFCTFWENVGNMYKIIKNVFEEDLCRAIVFGTPLTINKNGIQINKKIKRELKNIHTYKSTKILLIVIMQYANYHKWSTALNSKHIEIKRIMKFVKAYKIDGIQFSNLQPTAKDQLDTNMLCKIIIFFYELIKSSQSQDHRLMIGLTIDSYSQTISSSFESFEILNKLVDWYSIHTISMLKCNQNHMTGTSPLTGNISLMHSIDELMKTDIDMKKVMVGIQLYPNKFDVLNHLSYGKMCSTRKSNWTGWCASRPENFHETGKYLRKLEIRGVQLYYMESDDYRATCQCGKFPMTRALLRGLADKEQPNCSYIYPAVINQLSTCTYDYILNVLIPDDDDYEVDENVKADEVEEIDEVDEVDKDEEVDEVDKDKEDNI